MATLPPYLTGEQPPSMRAYNRANFTQALQSTPYNQMPRAMQQANPQLRPPRPSIRSTVGGAAGKLLAAYPLVADFGTWQHRDAAGKPLGPRDENGSDVLTAAADTASSLAGTVDSSLAASVPGMYNTWADQVNNTFGTGLPKLPVPSLRNALNSKIEQLAGGRLTPDNGGNLLTALNPWHDDLARQRADAAGERAAARGGSSLDAASMPPTQLDRSDASNPINVAKAQMRPDLSTPTRSPAAGSGVDIRTAPQTGNAGVDIRTAPQTGNVGVATSSPRSEPATRSLRTAGGQINAGSGWSAQDAQAYGAPAAAGVAKKNINGTDVYAVQEKGKSPLFTNVGNYKDASTFGVSNVESNYSKDPEVRKRQTELDMARSDVALAESPYERRQAQIKLQMLEQNQLQRDENDAKRELLTLRAAGKQMNPLEQRKLELEIAEKERNLKIGDPQKAAELDKQYREQADKRRSDYLAQRLDKEGKGVDYASGVAMPEFMDRMQATYRGYLTNLSGAAQSGKHTPLTAAMAGAKPGDPLSAEHAEFIKDVLDQHRMADGGFVDLFDPRAGNDIQGVVETLVRNRLQAGRDAGSLDPFQGDNSQVLDATDPSYWADSINRHASKGAHWFNPWQDNANKTYRLPSLRRQ